MVVAAALLHATAPLDLGRLTVHWSTVAGLAALAVLYEWGVRSVPVRPEPARRACFYSGLLVLFLSLNGPLHDLSDYYLFSAHMVQHMLLAMVVTPLLIAGTPAELVRPALRRPAVARLARAVTRPAVCFAVAAVTLAAWHLPPLYNLAMARHGVHIVQHLSLLVSSVLMWWPVMSRVPELPPLSPPLRLLYVTLLMLPMNVLGILITYAGEVLYPAYEVAPRIFPLSPLEDQLLGGIIMWIPGSLALIGVATVVFFRWAGTGAEVREELTTARRGN